jgi:hypothetical protein
MDNFGKSIPQSCSTNAETEAAYHFLNSPRVMHQSIIYAERDKVVSEIKAIQLPVVLSIGDVQEILQCRQYDHIHYIIRSKNDRKILDKDFRIRAYLDSITPYGEYELDIKESKEKRNTFLEIKRKKHVKLEDRTATIQVTFAKVTLKASNVSKNRPMKPVDVFVVRAKEVEPPNKEEAIDWVLLCSLPVTNFDGKIFN